MGMSYMAVDVATVSEGLIDGCWNGGKEKAEVVEVGVAATSARSGGVYFGLLHTITEKR